MVSPYHWGPYWWQSRQSVVCWTAVEGSGLGWPLSWTPVQSNPQWVSSPAWELQRGLRTSSVLLHPPPLPRDLLHPTPRPRQRRLANPVWTRCFAPGPRRSANRSPGSRIPVWCWEGCAGQCWCGPVCASLPPPSGCHTALALPRTCAHAPVHDGKSGRRNATKLTWHWHYNTY